MANDKPAAAGGEGPHTPTPWNAPPDSRTVQQCCLAYGGNSFSGPMKEALECHLAILKSKYPEFVEAVNSHRDLVEALRTISQGRKANEGRSEDALERIIGVARAALKKAGLL
jgi:hypothetical protein